MQIAEAEAIVTGAGGGIGAAIARELSSRDARLTLVDINREGVEKVAAEIEAAGGTARAEVADLSSLDEIEALAGRVRAAGGVPDIIVNNAGLGRWRAIDETEPGEVTMMIAIPYVAAFEVTRVFIAEMIKRRSGRVACMTSLSGYTHIPGANGYGVARWAMRAFASQLREDLRGTGVGVTLIAPAEVESPYFANNPGSQERIPSVTKLFGRAMTPQDVARASVDAIEHDRDEAIMPRRAELIMKLTPPPIMDALIRRTGWHRQLQAARPKR